MPENTLYVPAVQAKKQELHAVAKVQRFSVERDRVELLPAVPGRNQARAGRSRAQGGKAKRNLAGQDAKGSAAVHMIAFIWYASTYSHTRGDESITRNHRKPRTHGRHHTVDQGVSAVMRSAARAIFATGRSECERPFRSPIHGPGTSHLQDERARFQRLESHF